MYLKVVGAAFAAILVKSFLLSFGSAMAPHSDVHGIGTYLEVLGGLYSIVVAFVIYVVWDQFSRVQIGLAQEASAIEDLYRVATFLSDDKAVWPIRAAARQYLDSTAGDEPRNLAKGQTSRLAEEQFDAMCRTVRGVEIKTNKDEAVFAELLHAMARVSDARDARLGVSATRIPRTLWNLVVFASIALFGGFLALGIHSVFLSLLVVAAVASTLTFLLAVIQDMDNPFTGVWMASYDEMKTISARISQK